MPTFPILSPSTEPVHNRHQAVSALEQLAKPEGGLSRGQEPVALPSVNPMRLLGRLGSGSRWPRWPRRFRGMGWTFRSR